MSEILNVDAVHHRGKAELIVGIRENQFKITRDTNSSTITITDAKSGENLSLFEENKLLEHDEYPGCFYRIVNGEVEWENPPMVTGVEYRTTERYHGAIVYKKVDTDGNILWRISEETTWHLLASSENVIEATVE